ncbi:CHAT domain-containing protein [Agromyces sp. NPDC058484]|uniref:CHAT domain-containing protein n=1 Tax=Agromyces sp. NPDC058484 TaxID=3346524 RepID=UPI0036572AB0
MSPAVRGYDDLELRVDRDTGGAYAVVATAPDGRSARGSFTSPVTDDELDDFVLRVGLARRRRSGPDDRMGAMEAFGSSLFDALIRDEVSTVYHSARAAASGRDRGLRITLRLSGAPELMRLPWELLYQRPRFLAQSIQTPVVRTLDVDSALRPQTITLPLRILGVVSSPTGFTELDADAERHNLQRALQRLIDAGLVELSWLDRPTLGELARRVAESDDIHVLHYIGHGAYDEETESGIVILESPLGRAHDVTGQQLGAMLQDELSLRLVILNACEGARSSRIDPFSGVATSLVEFDIPAVVAMQFEITDDAAIAFSDSLYTGLAQGMPIDAAIAPARRAIVGAMREAEFATPVLYLRSGDAVLFDVAASDEGSGQREEAGEGGHAPLPGRSKDATAVPPRTGSAVSPGPHVSAPIATAWIGAGMFTLVGAIMLVAAFGTLVELASTAIIIRSLAVIALVVHYLTRPNRDGIVGAILYVAGLVLSVSLESILGWNLALAGWGRIAWGVVLVVIGGWLIWAGRDKDAQFAGSLRAPAIWVIAAGAADLLAQSLTLAFTTSWIAAVVWLSFFLACISMFAIAAGYAISARRLARERSTITGGLDE